MSDTKSVVLSSALGFHPGGKSIPATFMGAHGLSIPLHFKVLKTFGEQVSGVLIHVVGSLYLVIGHYSLVGSTSIYLLDRTRMGDVKPEDFIVSSMELREVVRAYGKAMVKSFYWDDTTWKPLKLPPGF